MFCGPLHIATYWTVSEIYWNREYKWQSLIILLVKGQYQHFLDIYLTIKDAINKTKNAIDTMHLNLVQSDAIIKKKYQQIRIKYNHILIKALNLFST